MVREYTNIIRPYYERTFGLPMYVLENNVNALVVNEAVLIEPVDRHKLTCFSDVPREASRQPTYPGQERTLRFKKGQGLRTTAAPVAEKGAR